MSRIKSNKEYAIRLTVPEHGEYYFSHVKNTDNFRFRTYVFTNVLSSVTKWKTISAIEEQVFIINKLMIEGGCKILFQSNESNDNTIEIRKKNYYQIDMICSDIFYNKISEKIEKIKNDIISTENNIKTQKKVIKNKYKSKNYETFNKKLDTVEDIEIILDNNRSFTNLLFNLKCYINDSMKSNVKLEENYKILEKFKMCKGSNIDVVDVSLNFRLIKLKNIKKIYD